MYSFNHNNHIILLLNDGVRSRLMLSECVFLLYIGGDKKIIKARNRVRVLIYICIHLKRIVEKEKKNFNQCFRNIIQNKLFTTRARDNNIIAYNIVTL